MKKDKFVAGLALAGALVGAGIGYEAEQDKNPSAFIVAEDTLLGAASLGIALAAVADSGDGAEDDHYPNDPEKRNKDKR